MRHRKANKTITRNTNYTELALYNLAKSLIEHKRIKTTVTRAKALRSYIEKLITVARKKEFSNADFRVLQRKLKSNTTLLNQLKEISVAYQDRPGGYTRVLKTGVRSGDNASMALIEFV